MKIALLISTYNWPVALEIILKSILNQTVIPDEILIANDGSATETKLLIEKYIKNSNLNIIHVWQEDNGFRKSMILNKAIAKSKSDYIIQIDGDCIINKHFIENHVKNSQQKTYLFGSRVNILPNYVLDVLNKHKINFNIFSKEIKNKSRTIYFPLINKLIKPKLKVSKKFRGCNVSFWRNDIIAINGYNEEFEGWGREDSDLIIRLTNNGIKGKRLKYSAILYHIYHKENSKHNFLKNDKIEQNTIKNKITQAKKGINQYLNEKR